MEIKLCLKSTVLRSFYIGNYMNKQLLNQIKNINYDKLKLVVIERRIKCKHLSQSQKYKWQKKNKKL